MPNKSSLLLDKATRYTAAQRYKKKDNFANTCMMYVYINYNFGPFWACGDRDDRENIFTVNLGMGTEIMQPPQVHYINIFIIDVYYIASNYFLIFSLRKILHHKVLTRLHIHAFCLKKQYILLTVNFLIISFVFLIKYINKTSKHADFYSLFFILNFYNIQIWKADKFYSFLY